METKQRKPRGTQPKTQAAKSKEIVQARRKKIIAALLDGKTNQQAGIEAGLSPKSARSQVSQILNDPKLQETLCQIYEKKGMTYGYAVDKHKDLMEANDCISCVSGKHADEKTVDFIDVPNWNARARGLDMYYKTRGVYQETKILEIRPLVVMDGETDA